MHPDPPNLLRSVGARRYWPPPIRTSGAAFANNLGHWLGHWGLCWTIVSIILLQPNAVLLTVHYTVAEYCKTDVKILHR